MRSSTIITSGLGLVGAVALAVEAVRASVLWIVEPGGEYIAPAGAAVLGVALVVAVLRRRTRPITAATALLLAGVGAGLLARLIAALTATDAGGYVAYGPGTPPSFSWMLLVSQVLDPALAILAIVLVSAGAVRLVVLASRGGLRAVRAE